MLTRKAGESLRIGPDVRLVVLATSGGQVRLGIDAPTELTVLREEVHERVAEANRKAAGAAASVLEQVTRSERAGSTEAGKGSR